MIQNDDGQDKMVRVHNVNWLKYQLRCLHYKDDPRSVMVSLQRWSKMMMVRTRWRVCTMLSIDWSISWMPTLQRWSKIDDGQDKMARAHTPNMVTWESFGQEQRIIRKHYRRDCSTCRMMSRLEFVMSNCFHSGQSVEMGQYQPSKNLSATW